MRQADWSLLLFLLLVLNVKMLVKLSALVLFGLLNRKLFRDRTIFRQRFLWFYYAMIGVAVLNTALSFSSISVNYWVAVAAGIAFWLMCILAAAIMSWYVRKAALQKLHATLTLFFILNIAVTLVQLLLIIIDSGSLNPYRYQGMYQKYFINTGDRLTGIVFDVSTTNALISSFGLVYFLSRNKTALVLLSMAALLLTTSNFANILLVLVLLVLFAFQSTRNQKSIMVICLVMLVFFLARVTPQNNRYVREMAGKVTGKKKNPKKTAEKPVLLTEQPDSLLGDEEKRRKIALLYIDSVNRVLTAKLRDQQDLAGSVVPAEKPAIPQPSIHSAPFQRKRDTSEYQRELYAYGKEKDSSFRATVAELARTRLPGKAAAFKQTLQYLKEHPLKIFTGTGTGNFSSKLAFRATGLRVAGGYPGRYVYTHPDFISNHLGLYLAYFSKDRELHSLVNTPNSVYDQLLAEYGVAGIACFLLFYIGFFRRGVKKQTYGLPLLLLLLGALLTEYWFEQLSIVVLFELMMLITIKETGKQDG